jgi:methionine-rich copper-binding protein CopC
MTLTKKVLPLAALLAVALPAAQASAAPKQKVRFTATVFAVAENTGSLPVGAQNPDPGYGVLTVTRQRRGKPGGAAPAVAVDYRTSDGSATADSDYTAQSGTLNFPACSGSPASTDPCLVQKIRVPITDDTSVEGVETVNVDLTPAGTSAVLVNPAHAVLNIVDNDAGGGGGGAATHFQFAAASEDVSEGIGNETVYILRSGDLSGANTVDYATQDGSATVADGDYSARTGTASFAAGDIYQAVNIPVTDDGTPEGTEGFSVALSNPSTGTDVVAPASQQINIIDNDSAASFEFGQPAYSIVENGGELLVTVRATGALGNNGTTVHFTSSDGTATAGSDYTDSTTDLLFDQGDVSQTIAIPIINDSIREADETIDLNLSDNTHPSWGTATATILDDDAAPVQQDSPQTPNLQSTPANPNPSGSQTAAADKRAPKLTLSARKLQKALKTKVLVLAAKCDENCAITVSAKVGKGKKAITLGKATAKTARNAKATIKIKLSKKVLAKLAKTLKKGKVTVTVSVIARDGAGNQGKASRSITVRR